MGSVLPLVSIACGGPIPEEEIASNESALCSAGISQPMQECAETTAVSPSTSYSEQCDGYFAADFTNTYGKTFTIGGGWGEFLTDKPTECPYLYAKVRAYGLVWTGAPCSGFCLPFSWQFLGERTLHGKWYSCQPNSRFCPMQGCYLEIQQGLPPITQQSSDAIRVRVEVQATHHGYGSAIYKKAEASVFHVEGCIH